MELLDSPLLAAVGNVEAVSAVADLLAAGAEPNVTTGVGGVTPLHIAALLGRIEVCAMLMDAGADPILRANGRTARDAAIFGGQPLSVLFLDVAMAFRQEGRRLARGHSFMETTRMIRKEKNEGDPCGGCGIRVPANAKADHAAGHLWETGVQKGKFVRGWAAPGRERTEPTTRPTAAPGAPSFEYQEFRIPLDGREYESAGIRFDGGLTWSDAAEPINRAVLAFVRRMGEQGWEPMEPIDADRLFRANRIVGEAREKSTLLGFGSPNYVWRPREVRINCRRRVG
jgi:Ankyrin repeat